MLITIVAITGAKIITALMVTGTAITAVATTAQTVVEVQKAIVERDLARELAKIELLEAMKEEDEASKEESK